MKLNKWHYTYDIHNYVKINNKRYKLNTAYDNIMVLIRAMNDEFLEDKTEAYLRIIFYDSDHRSVTEDLKRWNAIDIQSLIADINKNALFFDNKNDGKKDYDLELDADLIFASFYKDYNISLVEKKGKMKWVEFLMLLENLSEDTALMKIITLSKTPSKELTIEGRRLKIERIRMLSNEKDLNAKLRAFENMLIQSTKRKK